MASVSNTEFSKWILFEDADLLVLDKPSGLVVNRSSTAKNKTLQDYLIEYLGLPLPGEGSILETAGLSQELIMRSGLAHRLDKDTSGVLLVGKTATALDSLMASFKEREVKKEYLALVHGKVTDPIIEIKAPIGRNPKNKFKFAVVSGGKPAYTEVQVQETGTGGKADTKSRYSLVVCRPYTGRTHQIRVHLAAINHPVVGDSIYCPRNLYSVSSQEFTRLMLHSWRIHFPHPRSGEIVTFEAKIPPEFKI